MLHAQADLKATLAASVFFTETQTLLLTAKNDRSDKALTDGAKAVDSVAFARLPGDAQEDLLTLYAAAMMANGYGSTA